MVAAAEARGRTKMIGFNNVGTPTMNFARVLIAKGRIGRPVYARIEHTGYLMAEAAMSAA